jgi:hypothetical protein
MISVEKPTYNFVAPTVILSAAQESVGGCAGVVTSFHVLPGGSDFESWMEYYVDMSGGYMADLVVGVYLLVLFYRSASCSGGPLTRR